MGRPHLFLPSPPVSWALRKKALRYGLSLATLATLIEKRSYAPVKLDQGHLQGGDGPRFRGIDEAQYLIESGVRRTIRWGTVDGGFPASFLGCFSHAGSWDWASKAASS